MPRSSMPIDAPLRAEEYYEHHMIDTWRLTAPQQRFVDDDRFLVVFWGGNGVGKSMALAYDLTLYLQGRHPRQDILPPVKVGLFGETWQQIFTIMEYVWAFSVKRLFSSKLRLEGGQSKGQKYAIFDIVAGPGQGGRLQCGTYSAGAKRLAGPRYHRVYGDEPMPQDIWGEIWPRLLGRGGKARIGFTPTLGTAHKVDYLWQLIDDPEAPWAGEIQVPLSLDAVTPRGGLFEVPWITQSELDRYEAGLLGPERECRMGRSRVPIMGDRFFTAWCSLLVTVEVATQWMPGGCGSDHGSLPGAQCAVLIACAASGSTSRVWVLDEYVGDGRTRTDDDAAGILEMLDRNDLRIQDIDMWIGDRAHKGDKYGGYKSNRRLQAAIARAMGIDSTARNWRRHLPRALQRMFVPRKYDRSVWDGCEVLHRMMVDQRMTVITGRAPLLREAIAEWQGAFLDPAKDKIDGLRYITVQMTQMDRSER